MYGAAGSAVLVWSMGITQHERGADNVAAIVNLALARGQRRDDPAPGSCRSAATPACRAAAEMGAYATAFPGGVDDRADHRGGARGAVRVPGRRPPRDHRRGDGRGRRPRRARRPLLVGRQLPRGAARSRRGRRRARPGCRCACTRTSSCRARCSSTRARSWCCSRPPLATSSATAAPRPPPSAGSRSAPRSPGPRPGEARSEWEIFVDLAQRVRPRARAPASTFASGQAIRDEIARVVPAYSGVELLSTHRRRGAVGRHPAVRGRDVPDARRQGALPGGRSDASPTYPTGSFVLSTRRGKQFNTMVHDERDPLTGAMRDALFMASSDIRRARPRRWRPGARAVRRTARCTRTLHGAPLRPGNVQVFFPEGNVLLRGGRRDPASGVPDYNALVTVEPALR